MKKKLLSVDPIGLNTLLFIRIIIGYMFLTYGIQIFDKAAMTDYGNWSNDIGLKPGIVWAYVGKATEFIGGICFVLGCFVRIASIPMTISMSFITFLYHKGQPFAGDEHPFLLMLLACVFFFIGSGKYSIDYLLFKFLKQKNQKYSQS